VLEAMEASQAYRSAPLESSSADPDSGTFEGAHLAYDDDGPFKVENRMLVEELLDSLPPREQLMVRLRFYEEMTQSEIAERLDISQMHVSRLLSRCLEQLRTRLAEADVHRPD
ncbi:MAG: sigma-70 family RNA polymerase sigma factor, partial [Aquihabitans sp.]